MCHSLARGDAIADVAQTNRHGINIKQIKVGSRISGERVKDKNVIAPPHELFDYVTANEAIATRYEDLH
jgi:hypothetical protein